MEHLSDALLIVERDLEKVFVMEQRGFITMKLEGLKNVFPGLEAYSDAVSVFNAAFEDHRSFEHMYLASLENRTRDNALILDAKNDHLSEMFDLLKPVILATRDHLRCRLEK